MFISMDGKGRWKCECLRELETGSQVRQALEGWFRFYSEQRPHTAFDDRCRREALISVQKIYNLRDAMMASEALDSTRSAGKRGRDFYMSYCCAHGWN